MGLAKRLLGAVRDDAKAAGRYSSALLDIVKLSRRKKADAKALVGAYRSIGEQASDQKAAEGRRSYDSVKEREEALAGRRAAHEARQGEATAAREKLAERARVRGGEISALEARADELGKAHAAARSALAAATSEIARIRKSLSLPDLKRAGEPPPDELRAKLAPLEESLGSLGAAEAEAGRTLEATEEELRGEKLAWKEEEDALEEEVRAHEKAVRRAEAEATEAQAALGGSHEDLGKSVYLAGIGSPELEAPIARARALSESIRACEAGLHERRVIAATSRSEAMRFLLVWGAVAVLTAILLIVLLSGGNGEQRPAPAGPGGGGQAGGTAGGTRRPTAGAPSLTEALRNAILAGPALVTREADGVVFFRATGKIDVTAEEPAAGGGRKLSVAVGVERRLAPGAELRPETMHLLVVTDSGGRVIRIEPKGTTNAEDRELEALLEQWQ